MAPVVTSLSTPLASVAALLPLPPIPTFQSVSSGFLQRRSNIQKRGGKPSIYGTLLPIFNIIQTICQNLMTVWKYVYPVHMRNTALAQSFIDEAYLQYSQGEWEEKQQIATAQMMRQIALRTPLLFVTSWILPKEEGSAERSKMTGLLKLFNPEYYEANKEVLGEAMDWSQLPEDVDEEASESKD